MGKVNEGSWKLLKNMDMTQKELKHRLDQCKALLPECFTSQLRKRMFGMFANRAPKSSCDKSSSKGGDSIVIVQPSNVHDERKNQSSCGSLKKMKPRLQTLFNHMIAWVKRNHIFQP